MPTDISYTDQPSRLPTAVQYLYAIGRRKGQVPGFAWSERVAHWAIRIPLAGLLFYYGAEKFPYVFTAPGDFGVPAILYILAGFAEIFGAIALIAGGVFETIRPRAGKFRLFGDALTRAGGAAGAAAVMGVIAFFYWGALTIADLQVMALGLSAFMLLRGNRYGRGARA